MTKTAQSTSLQQELDYSILDEENLSKVLEERAGTLDISDSLKCHRMRYLKYYGYPGKEVGSSGLRSFLMGRVIEKVLVNYFRFRGILIKKGQYLKHYLDGRIRGKTDFTLRRNGKNWMSELKSYDGWGFYRRKKEPENISLKHEAQALNYVDILLKQGEDIESQALIVEVSRDNVNIIETKTRPIDQLREELHWDWNELIKAIDTKQIPAVLPNFPKAKDCSWCMKKEMCKDLYDKEKKQKKPIDPKDSNNPK